MTCATCNKKLVEKTIATKTHKVGKHVVVEAQRQALVCDCGVLAWDPAQRASLPLAGPTTGPWEPYVPGVPFVPYSSPNSATPLPKLPYVTS